MADRLPYNVVVEFPALPGVRLVSNVLDVTPADLAIGDALALVWDEVKAAGPLPRFRRRWRNGGPALVLVSCETLGNLWRTL